MLFKKNKKEEKKVAPHLPKEVRLKGGEAIERENWFLKLFILAVVFGFASGIVGGMIVNSRFFDNWLWGEGGAWKSTVTVNRTESKNLSRDNLNNKALSVAFEIYPASALSKDSLIDVNAKVGSGFFLTSNGYAATVKNIFERFNKKDLIAVNSERKVFRFGTVYNDPISDLAIVKMEGDGGGNLPFAYEEDIYADLDVWLPFLDTGILQTKVLANDFWSPKTRSDYYFDSEKIYRFGLLEDLYSKKEGGSALIDLRGEVVGMVLGVSEPGNNFSLFLKSPVISSALKKVLDKSEISRSYLGLHYQEVNNLVGSKMQNSLKYGIVLSTNPVSGALFVDKKSPLLKLGLQLGDIVTSINDEVISPLRSLPEILLDYSPGDKLKIKYERAGAEKNLEVNLLKI
ncbi:MAG: S1C family serine protease [Candidatus Magasanikbacteria bacterium]|nr:S1C family serine protease [Candidatus Magasanikbacteria bacterium]